MSDLPAEAKAAGWPWPVILLSLAIPAVLAAAVNLVRLTLPPGAEFTGFFRPDMMLYPAYAREVFENGNGLLFGNAYSDSSASPRVYAQLQIVLLGWIWKITGLPLPLIWQGARFVFGACMFLALYRLLRCFFDEKLAGYAFALCALGGGAVALSALLDFATGPGGDYLQHYRQASLGAAHWQPNVFQNALYTTESFYHALAFWLFALVLERRTGPALAVLAALWASHPFTGVEATAIVGAWCALELLLVRDRRALALGAGVTAISVCFLLYYLVLIPHGSPEAAYVLDVWSRQPFALDLADVPRTWGLFLLAPPLLLHPQLGTLLNERRWRFITVWIAVVCVLLLHDRLPGPTYQPLHFAHGYLFLPLAILGLQGLDTLTKDWPRKRRRWAAVALLAVAMVDNVVFTTNLARHAMRPAIEASLVPILDRLRAEKQPRTVAFMPMQSAGNRFLARYIPVVSAHRVYLVTPYVTPFYPEKLSRLQSGMQSGSPIAAADSLGIEWVITRSQSLPSFAAEIEEGKARVLLSTTGYELIEVAATPRAGRPR